MSLAYDSSEMRRILLALIIVALLLGALGAYMQARRSDSAADPGWTAASAAQAPPAVSTPLLSVRRVPEWLAAPVAEARLAERISEALKLPGAPPRTCLVAYRGDEPVVSVRAGDPLLPASLAQIVTAAAILETAGPLAAYTTEVFASRSALASVSDGVLTGDVFLVGRGDPVLSTRAYVDRFDEPVPFTDFTELAVGAARALRALGVNRVQGRLIADESRFPEAERDYASEFIGSEPVWPDAYLEQNRVGPLSALLLNDGFESFAVTSSAAGRRLATRSQDPALSAAGAFVEMVEALGVTFSDGPAKGVTPALAELTLVAQVKSPPMSEIVKRMLTRADDTIAEMLLKEIGRRSSRSERAWAVLGVYDVLQRVLEIPTDEITISDGSGLSPQNRLTCELIATLLRASGPGSPLMEGLAVLGDAKRFDGCAADDTAPRPGPRAPQGRAPADEGEGADDGGDKISLHAGSLDGVSSVAGVSVFDGDETLTFVMIANGDGLGADLGVCDEMQRLLVSAAAGYPYGPSADDAALVPLEVSRGLKAEGGEPNG